MLRLCNPAFPVCSDGVVRSEHLDHAHLFLIRVAFQDGCEMGFVEVPGKGTDRKAVKFVELYVLRDIQTPQ